MAKTSERWVVLLRGVNVGGNRKLPMAELRTALQEAGLGEVRTYIASGNILVDWGASPGEVEGKIEQVIKQHFGDEIEAIARSAGQWAAYAAHDPFPDAAFKMLHLCLAKRPLHEGAVAAVEARCKGGERVKLIGDALWVDYGAAVARSKLTPVALDKAAGSCVTARNRNTVLKLAEMARE